MKKQFKPVLALLLTASLFSACKKDKDPQPDDEHATITRVTMLFENTANANEKITVNYVDLDGPGGQSPTIDQIRLKPNTTYTATLRLYTGSNANNLNDITDEIKAEGDDHEFFFTPAPANLLTVTKTDRDTQLRRIGLESQVVTTAINSGTLNVKLMHQPDQKPDPGSATVGETDVDINFSVVIAN